MIEPESSKQDINSSNSDQLGKGAETSRVDSTPVQNPMSIKRIKRKYSPWRIMLFSIVGIALAEVIAMIFVYYYRDWPYYLQVLLDALIMTAIIFPLLYLLLFKPLIVHMEERNRFDNILEARLQLMQLADSTSDTGLFQAALDAIERMTDSQVGFFHLVEPDQKTLTLQAWSTNTIKDACTAAGSDRHYNLEQAGVWADCIRHGGPLVHNDYRSLPYRKGMPDGHVAIQRELVVPIKRNGKIVAILGVGNKPQDYDNNDVNLVSGFADLAWDSVQHKQAQIDLRKSEFKFRTMLDWTYDWENWVDPLGNLVYCSPSCERITGYGPDEFISDPALLLHIVHPEDRAAYLEHHQRAHDHTNGTTNIQYRIIAHNGEEHWLDHICRPIFGPNQKYLGRRVSNRDITIRVEKERQVEAANLELQRINAIERDRRQLTDMLVEMDMILQGKLDLDSVLSTLLASIRKLIPFRYANITLLDGESFSLASQDGLGEKKIFEADYKNRYPLEKFPILQTMQQTHQPVLIFDTRIEPDSIKLETWNWVRACLCAPLIVNQRVIGSVNLLDETPAFFTQAMIEQVRAFASHGAVAIQSAWLFEQIRSGNERLHALSQRLVEIQENERQFIARELHDESGQALTSLMLDLRLLKNSADHPEQIVARVTEMESALDAVMKNLHRVAMALRPASLDHLGLVPAIRQHLDSVSARYGLKINFDNVGVYERLPENVETVLYRIVQEALTNVNKHAHASQVDVILMTRNDKLLLIIEDDGRGFDPELVVTPGHLGLFGMRERAQMVDGKLIIESAPGKGTTIKVEVNHANAFIDRG